MKNAHSVNCVICQDSIHLVTKAESSHCIAWSHVTCVWVKTTTFGISNPNWSSHYTTPLNAVYKWATSLQAVCFLKVLSKIAKKAVWEEGIYITKVNTGCAKLQKLDWDNIMHRCKNQYKFWWTSVKWFLCSDQPPAPVTVIKNFCWRVKKPHALQ